MPVCHGNNGMGRRGFVRASVCLLVALATTAATRAEVTVSLKPKAEAAGRLVRVADIAHVVGDEPELVRRVMAVMVGAAPRPGDMETIARDHVRARVYQEGLPASDVVIAGGRWVAVTASVTRRDAARLGVTVAPSGELLRAVRVCVADEMGCSPGEIDVELLSLQWTRRPDAPEACQYAVSKRTSGRSLGRAHYIVDALDGSTTVGRALVWTESIQYRNVVAPRRELQARDVIGAGDLVVVKAPVRDERVRFVADPSQAVGREVSRRVDAEQPLAVDAVRERPLVRKGQMVTVLLETPHCKIADTARAQRSGALGQVIPVRNLRSNRTFLARVVDEQRVAAVPSGSAGVKP